MALPSRSLPVGPGLGRLGTFILHAAIWHIVGQGIRTIFVRYPTLGSIVAVLLVVAAVYALFRWLRRRSRNGRTGYGRAPGRRSRQDGWNSGSPRDW